MSKTTLYILLALWSVAMVLSGLSLAAEPSGDGFVRGVNRVAGFTSWQLAGAFVAGLLFFGASSMGAADPMRRAARLPMVISGVLLAIVLGGIAYFVIFGG